MSVTQLLARRTCPRCGVSFEEWPADPALNACTSCGIALDDWESTRRDAFMGSLVALSESRSA